MFLVDLPAGDDLEALDVTTLVTGVSDRLAALKKLTYPSQGLFGDLLQSAKTSLLLNSTCPISKRDLQLYGCWSSASALV